jgi:Na+/proline symporter
MSPKIILLVFLAYTVLLFFVTWLTSRRATNATFYLGNKASPWLVVAYGMIGASLSGVTFMSVPGWVKSTQFTYMVLVLGYLVGYYVIALILMPLYYRMNLTSIYGYLGKRFGEWSHKTGATFFLLSRTVGASLRMFLVVNVLHVFVFEAWGIPFGLTVAIFVALIILYTFQGGIKTIVWTDTLQTTFMLLAVVISIIYVCRELDLSLFGLMSKAWKSEYTNLMQTDWHAKNFYLKHFLGGAFIAIAMTGLDQEMMQKNLSCRTLKEAQKNMFVFSHVLILVNLIFLLLGAALVFYANSKQIVLQGTTDDLFPTIALQYLQPVAGIIFLIGLISAAYPSADGALTSLTTSFTMDILGVGQKTNWSEKKKTTARYITHFSFALLLLLCIVFFKTVSNKAVIDNLFTFAGFTYGPLLGLFAFGIFTKYKLHDAFVPLICLISPVICYFLNLYSVQLLSGYKFGYELLIANGLISFFGLWLIRKKE